MKQLVLIDGENFVHSLLQVLAESNPKIGRQDLLTYPIRQLLEESLELKPETEIIYFGTKLRLNTASKDLAKTIEAARSFQAKWSNVLAGNKITFSKSGYLRAREGDPCSNCGKARPYLLEKGVDVALAVKAVEQAKPGVEVVLVSSDTDLLPAVFAASAKGAVVTYVGFEGSQIIALSKTATKKVVIKKQTIKQLGKAGKARGK